jgi:hypothetical protein
MKHVTFTRDMRPHSAGDKLLVPDDVAARLAAEGVVEPDPPDFPARPAVSAPASTNRRDRRAPTQLFQTK